MHIWQLNFYFGVIMIDGGKAVLVLVICIVMMTKIAGNRSDRKGDPLATMISQ